MIESGGWSEWKISNDDQCCLKDEKWIKPKTRTCTNPEPKYGGKCLEEDGVMNISNVDCEPSMS